VALYCCRDVSPGSCSPWTVVRPPSRGSGWDFLLAVLAGTARRGDAHRPTEKFFPPPWCPRPSPPWCSSKPGGRPGYPSAVPAVCMRTPSRSLEELVVVLHAMHFRRPQRYARRGRSARSARSRRAHEAFLKQDCPRHPRAGEDRVRYAGAW